MEIDLNQLATYGKPIVIGGLSLTAFWTLIWPAIKKWFDSLPKTNADIGKDVEEEVTEEVIKEKNPNYDTDKLPPVGFTEHVTTVLGACVFAPPEIQLDYLAQGLTESKVLKLEIARMGKALTTTQAPVTRPAETEPTVPIKESKS